MRIALVMLQQPTHIMCGNNALSTYHRWCLYLNSQINFTNSWRRYAIHYALSPLNTNSIPEVMQIVLPSMTWCQWHSFIYITTEWGCLVRLAGRGCVGSGSKDLVLYRAHVVAVGIDQDVFDGQVRYTFWLVQVEGRDNFSISPAAEHIGPRALYSEFDLNC